MDEKDSLFTIDTLLGPIWNNNLKLNRTYFGIVIKFKVALCITELLLKMQY